VRGRARDRRHPPRLPPGPRGGGHRGRRTRTTCSRCSTWIPGAKRLGELGIGTNYDIQRFIKNILFDEKIGGTIHLALGESYAETGGVNKSALHWDMIKDLRQDGAVYVDGKLFQKNGRFV
jgi:leucyl aminopeptidase (aminopeptidase T)